MASVGSLSSSTSSSIRGYGGLASGLDRDELIKGMTIGTTTKLNQQEQKKQKIEWMQEAVRTISDKMIGFHSKYTETLTSPTNMFSSILWGRNKITTTGSNSKYVSITGTANSADTMTIMGVKQKAQNATWATTGMASNRKLSSEAINDNAKFAALNGKTLEFSYDGKDYAIMIDGSDADLRDATKAGEIIQKALDAVEIDGSKTDHLGDYIKVTGGSTGFSFSTGAASDKTTKLTGGTALEAMGIEVGDEGKELNTTPEVLSDSTKVSLDREWSDMIKGQTLTFSYNGTSTSVQIDKNADSLEKVKKSLQDSLDAKFGKGRVSVEIEQETVGGVTKEKLAFKTTVPGEGGEDDSSVLKLTGGSSDALKALGLTTGSSNRVNLDAKLKDIASLNGFSQVTVDKDGKLAADGAEGAETGYQFELNGKKVTFKADASVRDLMKAIERDANVTVSYQEASDKFTLTSKENGASGVIDFSNTLKDEDGNALELNNSSVLSTLDQILGLGFGPVAKDEDGNIVQTDKDGNKKVEIQIGNNKETLIEHNVTNPDGTISNDSKVYTDADGNEKYVAIGGKLYYCSGPDKDKEVSDFGGVTNKSVSVRGQDAIVAVKYAGSDDVVELRRDTNTFTVDGLTIGVKGEFGYETVNGVKQLDTKADPVEIDASVDVDKLMSTIKSFVEDYNAIVDMVNGELTTKHDSDYDPLTSEQKEELSESEIAKWEAKAKEGLLYGDSDLRSLSMDLRVVVSGGLLVQFEKVGISLSSSYSDNGKLSIDETKLRAALETDPESVEKLFTSKKGVDAQGNETFNGLATNLKSVMEKYVKTTGAMEDKGVLIRKAGSKSSALSLTQNYYFNQITSIDKLISTLQDRLKTEQDRYISQFSTLETLIANMNSQSSYLSSMGG